MSSQFSGYLSVMHNLSRGGQRDLWRTVTGPDHSAVLVTFRPLVVHMPRVRLYGHVRRRDNSTGISEQSGAEISRRWRRFDSNFAELYQTSNLTVHVKSDMCISTSCFRLLFSFVSETEAPKRLRGGLWNCSVDHYASFRRHLHCNVHTECEDGRDETEHCPFSSPGCQGLVALCDRCYKIAWSLRGFDSDATDMHGRGSDYCSLQGGMLSLPKCVFHWYDTLRRVANIYQRFDELLLGVLRNGAFLPNMYKTCIRTEDRAVLHHNLVLYFSYSFDTMCCYSRAERTFCLLCPLDFYKVTFGAVCELRQNVTQEKSIRSNDISLSSSQAFLTPNSQLVTRCPGGQMTLTHLLCGSNQHHACGEQHVSLCRFSDQLPGVHGVDSTETRAMAIPTFACSDGLTSLSFSLVCDFRSDCADKSDESLCRHPACTGAFTCRNGQCLSYGEVCNLLTHCVDASDEQTCQLLQCKYANIPLPFPPPALVEFDGVVDFYATPMNSNETCPDSHYRCPGDFNDCLPVYTRCNGMYDCLGHQDEEGCEGFTCPGFLRCRLSKLCVHSAHVCDGWPHCPMHDDELTCDPTCPVGCLCQGHSFLCLQPFSAALFPQLRCLDATGSGTTLSDVTHNVYLLHLVLARCSLTLVPETTLLNLQFLDLSSNRLQQVNLTSFLRLENLQSLSLSNNPLTSLHTVCLSVTLQSALTTLDLSGTTLTAFDSTVLAPFSRLYKLNLSLTSIHTIGPGGFQFTPQVREIHMAGSPLKTFPVDIFKGLFEVRAIYTENYRLCCDGILPDQFDASFCYAPKSEISSCKDLLESWTYRGFLWTIACLSVTGNVFCFCARLFARSMAASSGFGVFVTNLTMADFLMGVYIGVIGVADDRYRGRYLLYSDSWKHSVACQVAGFLSLLSSEVSALIICLITLDRFIVLSFPFSNLRFERRSAAVACLLTWMVGWFLAVLPLLPATAHWEFYSQTGICIPLPITRQEFKGRVYSFSVLVVFNFMLFLLISAGQAFIYWSIQKNALKTNSTKVSRDMTIARRLISVAVTDFMCWFPIGLCGIVALYGAPISGEVNVALAIFVLPLNSAINPFMYTFNTVAEKRRKVQEDRLLLWMESHKDLVDGGEGL